MAVLTAWPKEPNPKLLPWTIWRFKNQAGANPWDPKPYGLPAYAWEFLKWCEWKRKLARGIQAPRPAICTHLPASWPWNYLKQLNIAVPQAPKPPPPPPPNPIPPNSWKLRYPMIFTAHGWLLDSNFRDTDHALSMMADCGVGTVALQGGMFLPDTGDRVRAKGMDVAVWGAADSRDASYLEMAGAEGYMPQVEGQYELERALVNLHSGVGAGLSLGIVTTNAGLDTFITRPNGTPQGEWTTEQAEELISLGVTAAHPECYQGDMTPIDYELPVWETTHRGMYYVNPCISYKGITTSRFGKQVSIFLAEPMTDDQYRQIKAL